jgi:hypothetical protein
VSGDGACKVFTVTDVERGVTVIEKKFHKAEFGELLSHPEYKTFLDDLFEAVMVRTRNDSDLTDAAAEDNE